MWSGFVDVMYMELSELLEVMHLQDILSDLPHEKNMRAHVMEAGSGQFGHENDRSIRM